MVQSKSFSLIIHAQVLNKNLTVSSKIEDALDNVSVIMLALPTPQKRLGREQVEPTIQATLKKQSPTLLTTIKTLNKMRDQVILVEKSTVSIGTAKLINKILVLISIPKNRKKYIITSNPEFQAESPGQIGTIPHIQQIININCFGPGIGRLIPTFTLISHLSSRSSVQQSNFVFLTKFNNLVCSMTEDSLQCLDC